MNKYYVETPFDNWLIFDINKSRIQQINFSKKRFGSRIEGKIKELMLNVFNKKDLSVFDYSLINFDETKKSFKLYKFLIGTKTGETFSYSDAAKQIFGDQKYARATASMLHVNPLAFLIPCHRIVAKNGIGGYGFGVELKIKILHWENAL